MHFRSKIQNFNRENFQRSSLFAIIFFSLFFMFSAGCSDSKSITPPDEPLTDTIMYLFQDGDGEWTTLDEADFTETGIFTPVVTDSQGRYSMALVRVYGEEQEVYVTTMQTTLAEVPEIDVSSMLGINNAGTAALTVNVEGPSLPDFSVNTFYRDISRFSGTAESLTPGYFDLVLTQTESGNRYPSTLLDMRNLELVADETLVQDITTADLAGSITLSGPYTITVLDQETGDPLDSEIKRGKVKLLTSNLTFVDLGDKDDLDTDIEYTALGTPLTDADTYLLDLGIQTGVNHMLYYFAPFHDEGDLELSLTIDDFGLSFTESTGTGKLLPGMTIPDIQGVTAIGYHVGFSGNMNGISYSSRSIISAARQTGTTFIMPDLSSVTGWDTRWSIPVNAEIESTVVEAYIGSDYFLDQTSIFYYFMEISPGELYQNMEDGDWVAILMERISYGGPL
ncbi:MAG: hypothetical protein GX654_19935 [Desulfatiglans sp.]|nr:hypothetical protein [Desulfatiglans sp.]